MNLCTLILAAIAALPAAAGTIISSTGTPGNCCILSPAYASWTQTVTYNNVTITANIVGEDKTFSTGVAYLMNQIGPGATAANEIAPPADLSTSTGTSVELTLFTGLTLGPGTYYLVIAPVSNFFEWDRGTGILVTTVGTGVTAGGGGYPSTSDPFAPANTFDDSWTFLYSVTGDPAGVSATPEPATWALAIAGLAVIAARRRR